MSELEVVDIQKPVLKPKVSDEEVNEAAQCLGYAVIDTRKLRAMRTMGHSIDTGDAVAIGRTWLMMSQSACSTALEQIDELIGAHSEDGGATELMKTKQSIINSLIAAGKEMIKSGAEQRQVGSDNQVNRPGFGLPTGQVPIFANEVNITTKDND